MEASRFHIRALCGSGFPFTPRLPVLDADGQIVGFTSGDRHASRDDPYIRFDVGTTQVFRWRVCRTKSVKRWPTSLMSSTPWVTGNCPRQMDRWLCHRVVWAAVSIRARSASNSESPLCLTHGIRTMFAVPK